MHSLFPTSITYTRKTNRILYVSKGYRGEYTIGRNYTIWKGIVKSFVQRKLPCPYL